LLEHSDDGALGIVLNRPSDRGVADALAPWAPFVTPPAVLFGGGPVEPGAVIGLAAMSSDDSAEHWAPVLGSIGTLDLAADPDQVQPVPEQLRIFHGYAGWGPGQLEGELADGAWVVVAFQPDDAFRPQPRELWRDVLRRQGGRRSWLAEYPDDPSVN
jgi:putative transcriptional regulator